MFVGSWPIDMLEAPSDEQKEAYGGRIQAAIEKSLREAKRRSTWAAPDADYEQAIQAFAKEALRSETFLSNFLPFMRRVARLGIENSLVQTVCKLTAPGVPDIYQGCELWDLALVDPDNRRPVDFALRETAMKDLVARLKAPEKRVALFTTLMDEWAGRKGETSGDRDSAQASARRARAFCERRLSAAGHRGRAVGLGLRIHARVGGKEARRRIRPLSRASRGRAPVARLRAIAGRPMVRCFPRQGCVSRRAAARMADSSAFRGAGR
jgi:hypothetical protein